jgi:hypothetical protein
MLQKKISKLKFDLLQSADLLRKHELKVPHSDERPNSPSPNLVSSMQQTIDSQAAQIQILNNRLLHIRQAPRGDYIKNDANCSPQFEDCDLNVIS